MSRAEAAVPEHGRPAGDTKAAAIFDRLSLEWR